MNQPLYTLDILRLASDIPHLGPLAGAQGRFERRSPTCGSTIIVEVRLDGQGRVAAIGQQVEACAFGQASAALMGAHAIGRSEGEVQQASHAFAAWLDGSRDDPGSWPGLEALAPARGRRARHGAMLLPFQALLAAIRTAAGSPASSRQAKE
jgi:NifU-like protein involved in Fe-S cluster formation